MLSRIHDYKYLLSLFSLPLIITALSFLIVDRHLYFFSLSLASRKSWCWAKENDWLEAVVNVRITSTLPSIMLTFVTICSPLVMTLSNPLTQWPLQALCQNNVASLFRQSLQLVVWLCSNVRLHGTVKSCGDSPLPPLKASMIFLQLKLFRTVCATPATKQPWQQRTNVQFTRDSLLISVSVQGWTAHHIG